MVIRFLIVAWTSRFGPQVVFEAWVSVSSEVSLSKVKVLKFKLAALALARVFRFMLL